MKLVFDRTEAAEFLKTVKVGAWRRLALTHPWIPAVLHAHVERGMKTDDIKARTGTHRDLPMYAQAGLVLLNFPNVDARPRARDFAQKYDALFERRQIIQYSLTSGRPMSPLDRAAGLSFLRHTEDIFRQVALETDSTIPAAERACIKLADFSRTTKHTYPRKPERHRIYWSFIHNPLQLNPRAALDRELLELLAQEWTTEEIALSWNCNRTAVSHLLRAIRHELLLCDATREQFQALEDGISSRKAGCRLYEELNGSLKILYEKFRQATGIWSETEKAYFYMRLVPVKSSDAALATPGYLDRAPKYPACTLSAIEAAFLGRFKDVRSPERMGRLKQPKPRDLRLPPISLEQAQCVLKLKEARIWPRKLGDLAKEAQALQ